MATNLFDLSGRALEDANHNIVLVKGATVPTDGDAGYITGCIFMKTNGGQNTAIYVNEGNTSDCDFDAISTSVGGTGASSGLDGVYSLADNAITMDEGAITLNDATTSSADTLVINRTGAAATGNALKIYVNANVNTVFNAIAIDMHNGISGEAIFIDNGGTARTGSDILVTADSTGNHSVLDVNESGSGNTIVLDIAQAGSGNVIGVKYVGTNNSAAAGNALYVDLQDGDVTACVPIYISMGTGTRNVAGLEMVSTHTGSGALIDLSMDGNATGDCITIDMNEALDCKALYIDDGTKTRTDDLISIKHSGAGNCDVLAIVSTNTGNGAIFDINMDADGVDAGVFNIDMNLAVASEVMTIDDGGETRTANLFEIGHSGAGNVDVFAITDSNTGSGSVFDIDMSGATATGAVMDVDMGAAIARPFLKLDYGNDTRTADMIEVTFDGDGDAPFFDIDITNDGAGNTAHLFDIDVTAVFTGSILNVKYDTGGAATTDCIVLDMTVAVGAAALAITGGGARTDDLIKIDDASTGAGTRSIFDINITGAGTFPVLDISLANASVNATAIKITEGTGTATVPLIDINSAGTGATATIDIDYTGIFTGNCLDITYSTAASTGNAIDINMGNTSSNVEGMALTITSAGTGYANEGSAINVDHAGNLGANADCVRIDHTGTLSSTSVVLMVEATGTSTSGAYAVEINATGNNTEALKVNAGKVVFDESLEIGTTLEVTGASTLTGAVTTAAGLQNSGVARTAQTTAGGDGVVAAGTSWVIVTSSVATKIVTLPTPVLGNIIWFQEDSGQNGYEIACAVPTNQYLNNAKGSTHEMAVAADTVIQCVCNEGGATGGWICAKWSNVGAPTSAGAADAN